MSYLRHVALVLGLALRLQAQSDEVAVYTVVQDLLRALSAHDGATLFQILLPEATITAALPDGTIRNLNADDFIRRSVSAREDIRETIWDPQVSVQGDVATLIAPYDFTQDGKRTHCGVDAFTLLRSAGSWRVITLFFTIRTEDCPAHPLDVPTAPVKPRRR